MGQSLNQDRITLISRLFWVVSCFLLPSACIIAILKYCVSFYSFLKTNGVGLSNHSFQVFLSYSAKRTHLFFIEIVSTVAYSASYFIDMNWLETLVLVVSLNRYLASFFSYCFTHQDRGFQFMLELTVKMGLGKFGVFLLFHTTNSLQPTKTVLLTSSLF